MGLRPADVAIPLYDRFTALDAVGPYEVLSHLLGARVTFLAHEVEPVTTDNGMLTLIAEKALEELPRPELVMVPPASARATCSATSAAARLDPRGPRALGLDHLGVHGSLLLGAAGVLDGADDPRACGGL